jgi:hypothetical protein
MYIADHTLSNAQDTFAAALPGPSCPKDRLSTSVTVRGTVSHFVSMKVTPSSFVLRHDACHS